MNQQKVSNQKQKSASEIVAEVSRHRMFPFMKYKNFFMALSALSFGVSLFFIINNGFNFGIDFLGGVKLVYQFSAPTGDDQIRQALQKIGMGESEVVSFGNVTENSFLIKGRATEGKTGSQEVTEALRQELPSTTITLLSEEMVGPKVGADLRQRGMFAVFCSLALILLYIGWRFDFLFSTGAIVALAHDTVFALGIFTFFHKEFNLPILAAVLTLIGYSNNDTIIIYDRIRENLKKLPSTLSLTEIVDISLNETLSRSIITHLTVFFSVMVLFVYGGGVIHDFAFLMIVGVVVGSYSSIFIASPIYLWMQKLFPRQGLMRGIKR